DYPIFKIVANGGLSNTDLGEGRFYPSLVIDIGDNKVIEELFKLHQETPPGDTKLTWGRPKTFFKPKTVVLSFTFIQPMNVSFGIEFDIKEQYSLVDGVIQQRGLVLVAGKTGNKISDLIDESILVQVPNLGFDQLWDEILVDTLYDKYIKMGASRKDAKIYAKQHINSMREVWNIRREVE
ncbi:MAG TPA: hypothetical protein VK202_10690, partial [Bacteroidia bacterium]|nr:hypothetical protein [Bacteroidia bacterium]